MIGRARWLSRARRAGAGDIARARSAAAALGRGDLPARRSRVSASCCVAAQLPQAVYLPIWVALLGLGARRRALRAAAARPGAVRRAAPARIPSWALAARSRSSIAFADPPIVWLFRRPRSLRRVPVRARRHQVPRSANAARRHAARVPRDLPARHAVLLQPVAARGRSPRCRRCWRSARALDALCAHDDRSDASASVARGVAADGSDDRAGLADRGRALPAVSAPREPAVGAARRSRSGDRAVRPHVARIDQRAVAVRCRCVSRRLRRRAAAVATALLARTGAVAFQRPRMARAVAAGRRPAAARRRPERPLHGHARSRTTIRGCSRSTSRRRCREIDADGAACAASPAGLAGYSREQQFDRARAGHAAAALLAAVAARRQLSGGVAARSADRSRARRPAIRAPSISRARCAQRYPDDRRFISAVLQWFRSEPFFYTLAPPLLEEGEPVDMFLFDTRRGFCEHYASAFVVMLRAAGIPARVVTGYQGGEINPRGGYMIVRQSDAHAWAEAIVDGRWQRFDPTAAVAPSRVERGLFGSVPAGDPVPLFARAGRRMAEGPAARARRDQPSMAPQRDRVQSRPAARAVARMEARPVRAVAGGRRRWRSRCSRGRSAVLAWFAARRKRQERALTLWDDACRRLARAGLPRLGYEGPLAFAERAARRWPQFEIAFRAIGESFAALRYGTRGESRQRARWRCSRRSSARSRCCRRRSKLRAMRSASEQICRNLLDAD